MNFMLPSGAILLSLTLLARADDWPQFRGSNGGLAKNATPPTMLAPEKAAWTAELPEGASSPCVSGDSIFLTGVNRGALELETLCLDRSTGKIRWRKPIKVEKFEATHKMNNPAAPTPATDGKTVVAYFGSFGLVAYDFEGKELWRQTLPIAKTRQGYGTGSSPIIVNGRVIIVSEMGNDSFTAAYNLSDGKEIWKTPRLFNATWATPVHWREGAEDRVGVVNMGRFIAYDWKDGKELWWVDGVANQVCSTPIESNGFLYVMAAGVLGERGNVTVPGEFGEMTQKYDANKDGLLQFTEIPADLKLASRGMSDPAGDMALTRALGFFGKGKSDTFNGAQWEEVRNQLTAFAQSDMNKTCLIAVRTGGKGDVTASHVVWNESRGVSEVPSALALNGRVYCIKNGGVLTCRDEKTGKVIFEERIGAPGGYYASPVSSGENIYVASDTGAVTVLRASDKLEVVSKNSLGEKIQATPALSGSNIYIRTEKRLFAFGK
jgi:outer membrane protein assembly factor BamB